MNKGTMLLGRLCTGSFVLMAGTACAVSAQMAYVMEHAENAQKCEANQDMTACLKAFTKVIAKDDQQAVVQGVHTTKAAALIYAKRRIQNEIGSYAIVGNEECTQEYSAQGNANAAGGTFSANSYWQCTLTAKKKQQ